MSDTQLAPNANDGTLEGAVAAMAGINAADLISFDEAANRDEGLPPPEDIAKHRDKVDAQRQQQERQREPNGQFKPNDKGHEAQPPQPPQQAKEVQPEASDVAEEFFELPPETEGGEPKRIPAKEVFDGYQRAQQLQVELEQSRRVQPPPQEWDRQMMETVSTRTRLTQMLADLEQASIPAEPDSSLIDENSPRYDPAAYQRQLAAYKGSAQRMNQIRAMREAHQNQLSQEQNALLEARRAREQNKLLDLWPEIRDPATQRQVRDEAARFYGITEQDFANTYDSRMYALLKDALAFRASQSQRQAAVKVVRSVPKLVRAQARDNRAPHQRAQADAMRRLASSGSEEDAALALSGLF